MNRQSIIGAVCVVAICSILGVYWWKQVRPYVRVENAVVVAPQQTIHAKADGVVAKAQCHPGKRVAKGEELFVLFREEVQRELMHVECEIQKEIAALAMVKKELDEGMKKYIEANAVGAGVLEPALLAIQQAQIEGDAIESKIKAFELEKRTLSSQLETKITASVDGVVLQQLKREGDVVKKEDGLFTLSNPALFFVEASVPVKLLAQMQPGLSATVCFPSFSNQKWAGFVASVGPEVSNGHVQIRINAQDLPPYPGLTGEIQIRVK